MSDIRRDHDRQERTNTLAVVSFISSFFVAVAGIVTGHMALRQIRRTGEGGRGLAIAGLVIGYCSTATILIFVTVLFVATTSIVTATDTVVSVPSNTHNIDDPTPTPAPTSAPTPPSATLAEGRTWNATLTLDGQRLGVQLLGQDAPQAVASFISLATKSFFDQSACHRLTTGGFDLLQCGDPTGTGAGGPDYHLGPIENAPASEVYKKGSIVMARKGNDATSMGSQFFIVYQDTKIPHDPAGGYSVFGTVIDGLSAVEKIAAAGVVGGGTDGQPIAPAVLQGVKVE
ncbi:MULTISPECIES: peptidylprolyl isomerase [Paenarthrobacter]|uniref:Peptidylprolyl isomerase n=1 Tax=Paenarthrobacter ureafaciens TaxID=37931 RepID=A0AAX3EKV6_PAEUR|nr:MULTISPECIES: peptidylprolyl isomerase [Paenarthrobacter]MDO5863443.1 peptidylprolyl isomerase [Paenarthrobacter sp. SD-2]MDO5874512.1 peptidylprolyl isomerase [Paenarthrobacter sp. SD-1]UYV93918.1 peptidylprolyl isomerase [Paenarthrobacter ureafaciens]UYV98444.1 peptidylprolyl isomerase [Paenarthrobacter ureafaciens]WIV29760.1 peptidylprolyl isomerase [Paenarthrobacter sp. R1]